MKMLSKRCQWQYMEWEMLAVLSITMFGERCGQWKKRLLRPPRSMVNPGEPIALGGVLIFELFVNSSESFSIGSYVFDEMTDL